MPKYLVIRFSSIGDIVLTSPVIRALKEQQPDAEIHYVTKAAFRQIVEHNPHISRVITFRKDIDEITADLQAERYDFIIDLHRNLRSWRLKLKLRRPSGSFPKLNFKKFLLTVFKLNRMPDLHVVDRYFKAVEIPGISNDHKGLDYFIPSEDEINPADLGIPDNYLVYAIGAQFATKRMPTEKMIELVSKLDRPVVLLGGETDFDTAEEIVRAHPSVINLCGRLNLNQSASVVRGASVVITHDTGLMHIASAFNRPVVSIWGNTVPDFGMYPYMPQNPSGFSIHEVKGLGCRPCSKIGYAKCPKGHFKCMLLQDTDAIARSTRERQ